MSDYRLLEAAPDKRLLENANGYINEGAYIGDRTTGTLTLSGTKSEGWGQSITRPHVAGFRLVGPLPNVAAHILAVSRMDKLSSAPGHHQIVWLPGGNGQETSFQGGTDTNPQEVGDALRDSVERGGYRRRLVTIPTDWTWGDAEMVTRIDDMLTYAEANYGFNPPYHLVGVSMGTTCALNWAKNNLTKTKSISCMLPAVDLQDIEDNRAPAYFPAVTPPSVAYGTGTIPNAYNPASYGAVLNGTPIKLWYSTNDTICNPGTVTAFATLSGATLNSIGAQAVGGITGHSLDSGFVSTDIATFLAAND